MNMTDLGQVFAWGKPLKPAQQERAIATSAFNKSLLLKIPIAFDHWYEIRKCDNSLDVWRNDNSIKVFEKRRGTTNPVYCNDLSKMPRGWVDMEKWGPHIMLLK